MNILRVALFSVALFLAPFALASENGSTGAPTGTNTQTGTNNPPQTIPLKDQPQTETTTIGKLGGLAAAPFIFIASTTNNGLDWVAGKTVNKVVSAITGTSYLKDTRLNNPDHIKIFGKFVIAGLATAVAYKLVDMYYANAEDADEDIFERDFDGEEYAS